MTSLGRRKILEESTRENSSKHSHKWSRMWLIASPEEWVSLPSWASVSFESQLCHSFTSSSMPNATSWGWWGFSPDNSSAVMTLLFYRNTRGSVMLWNITLVQEIGDLASGPDVSPDLSVDLGQVINFMPLQFLKCKVERIMSTLWTHRIILKRYIAAYPEAMWKF